ALSSARADLLPSPKRIMSSDYVTDLEDSSAESSESSMSRETKLEIDVDIKRSDGIDIDLEIQRLMSVSFMRMLLEIDGLMLEL
nr:hypothetical protein [Tanacetum cinerariifolium]